MKQLRRNFIMTLASSLGISGRRLEKEKNYQVEYRCQLLHGKTAEDFYNERSEWENPEGIAELIKKYSSDGKIISFSNHEDNQNFSWRYTFRKRSDFEDFNREVFLLGYFDQQKVSSSYSYSLEGKVV